MGKTLGQIIHDAGMSSRPEYYSGRGATLSDLSSRNLEDIHKGISESFGSKAGNNFVKMVHGIIKLSATDFLNSLYALERSGWVWKKPLPVSGVEVSKDANGDYNVTSGLTSVFGLLSGMNSHDDTESIRGPFLGIRGIKSKSGRVYTIPNVSKQLRKEKL